jgi:hypothetical protein
MSRFEFELVILFFNKVYVFRFETLKPMSRIEFDLKRNLERKGTLKVFRVKVYIFRFETLKLIKRIESKFSKTKYHIYYGSRVLTGHLLFIVSPDKNPILSKPA